MLTITVLIENTTVESRFAIEHGLSFFIEHDGLSYIFDTGQSGLFLQNAEALALDPGCAAALILSHAHYDHCGGVRPLFSNTAFSGKVYAGPGFWDPKWALKEGTTYSNGIDFDQHWLEKQYSTKDTAHLLMPAEPCTEIGPHCFLVHSFTRSSGFETYNPHFLVNRN
ncbi:MAG: MBL fold metallo-hydrolase [Spirochaetes bacterium]|nr:MBL fold metallo-hydrolase [Spirochaetota bacterium]